MCVSSFKFETICLVCMMWIDIIWWNTWTIVMKWLLWLYHCDVVQCDKNLCHDHCWFFLLLTHRGRVKTPVILQTTFSDAFPWMKMYALRSRFHWSVFVWFQLTLVQIKAWRRPGNKPLSGPMMFNLLTYTCVTLPQWVNVHSLEL